MLIPRSPLTAFLHVYLPVTCFCRTVRLPVCGTFFGLRHSTCCVAPYTHSLWDYLPGSGPGVPLRLIIHLTLPLTIFCPTGSCHTLQAPATLPLVNATYRRLAQFCWFRLPGCWLDRLLVPYPARTVALPYAASDGSTVVPLTRTRVPHSVYNCHSRFDATVPVITVPRRCGRGPRCPTAFGVAFCCCGRVGRIRGTLPNVPVRCRWTHVPAYSLMLRPLPTLPGIWFHNRHDCLLQDCPHRYRPDSHCGIVNITLTAPVTSPATRTPHCLPAFLVVARYTAHNAVARSGLYSAVAFCWPPRTQLQFIVPNSPAGTPALPLLPCVYYL